MPSAIKIIISIKLITMILILHQTNGIRNPSFNHGIRPQYSTVVPGNAHDSIIMKWMNAETALRKVYFNLIKSLLPRAYGLSFTSSVSRNCTSSLFEYISGLRNMKSWAFKMFDSTGKIPNGIIGGNPMAFGDFDTCLDIESPSHKFQGKYCYIEMSLPLPQQKVLIPIETPVDEIHDIFEPESIFDHVAKEARFLYVSQLRLTACLPSTCSKEDIAYLISNAMVHQKSGTKVNVTHCEIKEDQNYTTMEIFILALFTILISFVMVGTFVDILIRNDLIYSSETTEKRATLKALLCFSAYSNYIRLIKIDHKPDTLNIFHGMRVLSMLWIIWSHSHLIVNYRSIDGGYYSLEKGKELVFQMVPLGFLAVETFFFMSSVLVIYLCIRMRGKIHISRIFLKRYLRLTPTMMLVVAFFAIIGRFGSGPLWRETVADTLSKNCLERGWMNLFYLNNYLYSDKICLGWTWYLSTDTHMFLLSLCVCVLMKRRPGRGLVVTGLVLIIGVLSTAFSHLYYELPPTYLVSYLSTEDWYFYAVKGYTQVHIHLPVCAVGIAVGYILATRKGPIQKHINAMGWFISVMIFLTVYFLTYKWNQGLDAIPNVLVSALYGSLHRFAWALVLAFLTLSCTWGQGGIVNSFLCWEGFVPFSRLTYMVYLIHYGLMYVNTGLLRQSMTFNLRTLSFTFFNNTVLSFLTAFVLGFFFEAPLMALEKTFSNAKLKKQNEPDSAVKGTVLMKNAI